LGCDAGEERPPVRSRKEAVMHAISRTSIAIASILSLGGCPQGTTVQLENEADSPVEVRLYYGDDQNSSEFVLEEFGEEFTTTIDPGEAVTFSRDCEELQAIYIENAELNIIGGIGPEADTGVFRDGDDFGCGDVLTFTFREDGVFGLDIGFNSASGLGGLDSALVAGIVGDLADAAGDRDDDDEDDDFFDFDDDDDEDDDGFFDFNDDEEDDGLFD
jgi:hypothetical protein